MVEWWLFNLGVETMLGNQKEYHVVKRTGM